MDGTVTFKGWVPLLGIPAFFLLAFIMGIYPHLGELPLCGVKLFIGVDCPGCGLTRSFAALAHGNLWRSIAYHPLGVVIAVWLLYQFARALLTLLIGRVPRPLLSDEARSAVLYGFLAALLIQWIAKLVIGAWG